jgi:hypothetical protein
MKTRYVMPCPEGCEKSARVVGCDTILKVGKPDGSCWRCDGHGFVAHDGNPDEPTVILADTAGGTQPL